METNQKQASPQLVSDSIAEDKIEKNLLTTKEMEKLPTKTNIEKLPSSSDVNHNFDISPATLDALKTLSTISSNEGIEELSNCDKLSASLQQIRAKKNINLFEKLDQIRQDFSGLNHKITQIEESIVNLRETTDDLVKSLPSE